LVVVVAVVVADHLASSAMVAGRPGDHHPLEGDLHPRSLATVALAVEGHAAMVAAVRVTVVVVVATATMAEDRGRVQEATHLEAIRVSAAILVQVLAPVGVAVAAEAVLAAGVALAMAAVEEAMDKARGVAAAATAKEVAMDLEAVAATARGAVEAMVKVQAAMVEAPAIPDMAMVKKRRVPLVGVRGMLRRIGAARLLLQVAA